MELQYTPEQAKKVLAESARMIPKRQEYLRNEARKIALMEAGLKERPLDRDFFDLCKMKHEQEQGEFDLVKGLVEVLNKD